MSSVSMATDKNPADGVQAAARNGGKGDTAYNLSEEGKVIKKGKGTRPRKTAGFWRAQSAAAGYKSASWEAFLRRAEASALQDKRGRELAGDPDTEDDNDEEEEDSDAEIQIEVLPEPDEGELSGIEDGEAPGEKKEESRHAGLSPDHIWKLAANPDNALGPRASTLFAAKFAEDDTSTDSEYSEESDGDEDEAEEDDYEHNGEDENDQESEGKANEDGGADGGKTKSFDDELYDDNTDHLLDLETSDGVRLMPVCALEYREARYFTRSKAI